MANIIQTYRNAKRAVVINCALFLLVFFLFMALSGPLGAAFQAPYDKFFYGIYGVIAGYFTIWLIMRIEGKTLSSIGMKWDKQTLWRFFVGMLIAFLIFVGIMAIMIVFTPLTLIYNPTFFSFNNFLVYLPILPLALGEELCFRSYPQVKLNNTYGIWVSQIVMAILFGAYHVLIGWNVLVSFSGPAVWALVFGLAAIKYGGIAVSTGIHFSINVLQSLLSTKGAKTGIWRLDYLPGTTQTMIDRTEYVGFFAHGLLLVGALTFTYFYSKKIRNGK
jgi:membrane protease YdiL (CAAX protease family)